MGVDFTPVGGFGFVLNEDEVVALAKARGWHHSDFSPWEIEEHLWDEPIQVTPFGCLLSGRFGGLLISVPLRDVVEDKVIQIDEELMAVARHIARDAGVTRGPGLHVELHTC